MGSNAVHVAQDVRHDRTEAVVSRPQNLQEVASTTIAGTKSFSNAIDEFIEKGTTMPALQVTRPVQIRIKVNDVPSTAAFYTAAFDLVFNESISSVQFGTYRSDQFFLIEEYDQQPPIACARFELLVDDVDAAHQRALDAGGTEHHPPTDFAWKPRTSCVRDPSGNLIDLSRS